MTSPKQIRALHSVGTFLNISENWIYPQIADVPHTTGMVLCRTVLNTDSFPISKRSVLSERPPSKSRGFRWVLDGIARRLGKDKISMSLAIRAWRPQILHAHFGTRGWECLDLKRRLGVPLVTSFYGYDAWKLPQSQSVWKERFRELFDTGELFLVEGPAMRDRLVKLGCPDEKIQIHRIGVDLTGLAFHAREFSGTLRIAMVGRFVEKKGLVDGLRACRLARSNGADISVTIVGDGDDGAGRKIKSELQSIAQTPELTGRVRFEGFLPLEDTRELLEKHAVILCPSRHAASGDAEGGSPVVLTEAMSLGLICIGTRHCDIPEVVVDGKTGFLCDEGDVEGIANVLMNIHHDRARLVEIAAAGREHISQNFSLRTQLVRARSLYENSISSYGYERRQIRSFSEAA